MYLCIEQVCIVRTRKTNNSVFSFFPSWCTRIECKASNIKHKCSTTKPHFHNSSLFCYCSYHCLIFIIIVFIFLCVCICDRVLHIIGWPRTGCVPKNDLEFLILPSLPLESWGYRHASPHPAKFSFFIVSDMFDYKRDHERHLTAPDKLLTLPYPRSSHQDNSINFMELIKRDVISFKATSLI